MIARKGQEIFTYNSDTVEIWRFNNDGSSVSGNLDSTPVGSPSYVPGLRGSSAQLNGSKKFSVSDDDSLSFGDASTDSAFSVEAVVKFTDSTSQTILLKGVSSNGEYTFGTTSGDLLDFSCYDNTFSGSTRITRRAASPTETSDEGNWMYYAGTYSGNGASSGLKIYRNATNITDTTTTDAGYTAMHNLAESLFLGGTATGYMNGLLCEIRISSIELSGAQITQTYNEIKYLGI